MEHGRRTPVAQWLVEQCREREVSWREASIGAGVDKGTISAIVRGQQPGLEVCKALAAYFRVPPEHVLRLAGHLAHEGEALPPEVDTLVRELDRLLRFGCGLALLLPLLNLPLTCRQIGFDTLYFSLQAASLFLQNTDRLASLFALFNQFVDLWVPRCRLNLCFYVTQFTCCTLPLVNCLPE